MMLASPKVRESFVIAFGGWPFARRSRERELGKRGRVHLASALSAQRSELHDRVKMMDKLEFLLVPVGG